MSFLLDPRIEAETTLLVRWPLSLVLLKQDATYPWLIVVPQVVAIQEIYQLQAPQRHQLMDEIARLSCVMHGYFQPDKLNVANLGNQVAQLHIHVVARFIGDPLWPQGIWQVAHQARPYPDTQWTSLCTDLRALLQ